jgi:hypothetical protein
MMAKSLSMSESFSVSVDEQTVCDETTLEEMNQVLHLQILKQNSTLVLQY